MRTQSDGEVTKILASVNTQRAALICLESGYQECAAEDVGRLLEECNLNCLENICALALSWRAETLEFNFERGNTLAQNPGGLQKNLPPECTIQI